MVAAVIDEGHKQWCRVWRASQNGADLMILLHGYSVKRDASEQNGFNIRRVNVNAAPMGVADI